MKFYVGQTAEDRGPLARKHSCGSVGEGVAKRWWGPRGGPTAAE